MKLLAAALLALVTTALLTAAVLIGYRQDQESIPDFTGTGIAAKIDVLGDSPAYVMIANADGTAPVRVPVAAGGSFAARLAPGTYRLSLPGDSRVTRIDVPEGDCVDLVLDFRIPNVVLRVPGGGWPIPVLSPST